jgi:hypothetical protein
MTKAQLDEYIEREASKGWPCNKSFKMGAYLLKPLLLEATLALNEMKYQAMRQYGTEKEMRDSEPYPWGLVLDALSQIEERLK